jgi:6-phosphogluconolactonase (cycloisomerase 2 family)
MALPFLAGCSGFWNASTTTTTTTTTTTLSSGYFYILDATTSQIVSFNIVSGTLTEIGSYAVPYTPVAITVAPNNKFLYVSTASGIYRYTLSGGTPTLISSAIASDPATVMQVDSTNSWLLEASGSGYLYAIHIDPDTGALDSSYNTQSAVLKGSTINQLAISPNNNYVFAAAGTDGTAAFTFSAKDAAPLGSTAYDTIQAENTSSGAALSVAVDTSNRFLYIGEAAAKSSAGGLRVFTLGSSSGALTELSGSPYSSGGTGPYAILPKSTGDYVYVANWKGTSFGNITGFSITEASSVYSLTKLSSSIATGIRPMDLVEDTNHNFVIAVNSSGSPYLEAYIFDTTTAGALDLTNTSSTFTTIAVAANH